MIDRKKNRIAIVSQNKDILDFFSLEAEYCACPVQTFSFFPYDTSDFDIVIFDSALGICISDAPNCKMITVVADGNAPHVTVTEQVWEWPVSVEIVRNTYEEYDEQCERYVPPKNVETCIYVLSEKDRKLLYLNRQISLTDSEWRLLMRLGENKGEPVSRAELNVLLGEHMGNLVDVHMCNIRKKLETAFGRKLIINVRNKGYFLNTSIKFIDLR